MKLESNSLVSEKSAFVTLQATRVVATLTSEALSSFTSYEKIFYVLLGDLAKHITYCFFVPVFK